MPLRNQYVAQRISARMARRGEKMLLRRISLLGGPEPFKNPPDTSGLVVIAGNFIGGQAYLNLAGTTATGRLIPGDKIICHGVTDTTWTVVTMPLTVLTDSDGIPQVDGAGAPVFGSPPAYHRDTLGWNNAFPVVAVSGSGSAPAMVSQPIDFSFFADATVFGNPLSIQAMAQLGWVEVDTVGLSIAGKGVDPPPKVNDQVILTSSGNEKREIIQVGKRFSNGTNFLFPVQAR